MNFKKTLLLSCIALSSNFVSISAHAAYSWTFTGNGNNCAYNNSCDRSSIDTSNANKPAITAQVSGFASRISTDSTIHSAQLNAFSHGLGVSSYDGDSHTVDNGYKLDSVLFSFNKAVSLEEITLGYPKDADFSLFRFTGQGTNASSNILGKSYAQLADSNSGSGWELVSNNNTKTNANNSDRNRELTASNIVGDNDDYTGIINPGVTENGLSVPRTSSFWLIAALNHSNYDDCDWDSFKIKNIEATYPGTPGSSTSVPEPSSTALMALALAAFGFNQRKKKNA